MTKTYWRISPRGFGNEYTIGVATSADMAASYEDRGYERITRDQALRWLVDRGDAATKIYAGVEVDGEGVYDRFEVARAIRANASFERLW